MMTNTSLGSVNQSLVIQSDIMSGRNLAIISKYIILNNYIIVKPDDIYTI